MNRFLKVQQQQHCTNRVKVRVSARTVVTGQTGGGYVVSCPCRPYYAGGGPPAQLLRVTRRMRDTNTCHLEDKGLVQYPHMRLALHVYVEVAPTETRLHAVGKEATKGGGGIPPPIPCLLAGSCVVP